MAREWLLALLLVCLLDRLFGWFVLPLYDPYRPVTRAGEVNTEHAYGQLRAACLAQPDVLILGSSRALAHYDDRLLSRLLGQKTFNAGCDGMGLLQARATFSLVRRAHPVKLVLFDDVYIPAEDKMIYRLEPWLGADPVVDSMLVDNWRERLKCFSDAYRCGGTLFELASDYGKAGPTFGFQAKSGSLPAKTERGPASAEVPLPPWYATALAAFATDVRESGARLVLVESPIWLTSRAGASRKELERLYSSIERRYGATQIHLGIEKEPVFDDATLFADGYHLNGDGAEKFTERLAAELTKVSSGPRDPSGRSESRRAK